MTDRPILFSGPMVQAILEGRKTQTRRALNLNWNPGANPDFTGWRAEKQNAHDWLIIGGMGIGAEVSTPIAIGDRLWVREAWRSGLTYDDLAPRDMSGEEPLRYEADMSWQTWGWKADCREGRLRAAMHMPRWASRMTLTVTDVRVERLQDISEADAIAEGCKGFVSHDGEDGETPVEEFHDLWNSINGAGAWEANPWAAAYTYTVARENIDAAQAA